MPIAQITLIEGNSEERKRDLIARVTDAFVESLGAPRELVRVIVTEVPSGNWGVGGVPFADRLKRNPE